MRIPKTLILWAMSVVMTLFNTALAAPATITQSVTYNGETITMQLNRENLRGSNFELLSQNASGGYDTVTPVDERSYIGTVDEYPGAVSCGILLDNGTFKGAVYFDRGVTWFTQGTSVFETRALNYGTFSAFQPPTAPTVGAGQAGSTTYGFELGIDADHNYYTTAGSSVATALEGIEYSVCVVRAIYMRDVLLRPYLGRVIIRATLAHDPYTGLNQGGYLGAVRTEWNTNQTTTDPDLVAGVSPTKIGGGLAWVGVVDTSNGYSVNQSNGSGNFDVVFRHEMGHNWDCGHFVGGSPEGAGLMGGNQPGRFSGCEAYRVLNHRNAKIASLDNEGTFTAVELPPYASMDAGEFTQTVTSSLTLDVLANDHDANGQTLSLVSFDSTSANGGTVTQQGQNLVYTAQGNFIGTDYFTYKITDTAGKTATGVAIIEVLPNDPLRMYLALDETTGTAATDASAFTNSATLSGTDFATASVAGQHGTAVNLDGTDDHVTVSNVQLNSNTVTITAWVKQNASQNDWAGIVHDKSSGSTHGLHMGTSNELRYTWNNNNWSWNSGLTPPADTWTFVALVVEPNKATMYMNTGSGFQSAVNNVTHSPATFGTTYIGWDSGNAFRHFSGVIDDARIYNYAMSQAELQNIADGGSAASPNPFVGATNVNAPVFKWSPSGSAQKYEFYLGTDQASVTNATTASPEYLGSTFQSFYTANSLAASANYYWRVDSVTPSGTQTGDVWSFTTAATIPEFVPIVPNGDFENRSGYAQYQGSIDWAVTSGGWVNAATNTSIFTADADGNAAGTYLYMQGSNQGTGTSEAVHVTIREGARIEAAVKVGLPKLGYSQRPNDYGLEILIDDIVVASTGQKDIITDLGATPDSWVTLNLGYTATALDEGKALKVKLINYDGTQAFFDNATVRVATNAVINGDFEDRSGYSRYSGSPNWTISTGGGWVDVVSHPSIVSTDADGNAAGTYLFIQGSNQGEATSDALSGSVQNGDKIVAGVKVARPMTVYSQQPNNYGLEILLDGVVVASTGPKNIITDLGATPDSWVSLNLDYTVVAADAGKTPTIRVINYNGAQAFFDNVTAYIITSHDNNQAPMAFDAGFNIAEDATVGASVGTVSATDPNAGDTLTYAITAGNTGGAFAINSSTGAITTAAALDHEVTASYALTVTVTDDSNPSESDASTITVNVTNVNEAPSASDTSGSVVEDVSIGTSVATVTATDPDAGDTLTYAITGGNTGGAFAIDSSGNITTATALDYETTASYTLTITVTDSGSLTDTATVNVTVTDVAEATGPKLVRTTVNNVSSASWTSVNLGQSYNSAVIIATPMYPNSSVAPVVTRIRNVSGSGFEVKLDRTDGQTGTVTMDVSVIAVEEGVYTVASDGVKMEAVKYTSTVTGAKNAWTAENRSYQNSYTNPVVVGQVMSANDADWSAFWCHGSSRTNPPNGSNLNVGKMVAEDPDTTRVDETVGYIVIESGSGSMNGVNYTAGLGSDTVRGTGNTSVGYNYSLSGLSSASAAAVSLAGLDGGDGGWAVLYGSGPLSSTTLTIAVDEDQLSNSERSHTTEQCGYIVFE